MTQLKSVIPLTLVFALGAAAGFSAAHLFSPASQAGSNELAAAAEPTEPTERIVRVLATPDADRASISLSGTPTVGPADAPIELVVFADFQCAHCGRASDMLKRVVADYPEQVRLSFRHLPLPEHALARPAHRAALAAERQGAFWAMHDRIFGTPGRLDRAAFIAHAEAIGLDLPRFLRDLDDPSLDDAIERDLAEAARLDVRVTPTFLLNGQKVIGAQPYANFRTLIERERTRIEDPSQLARTDAAKYATSRLRALRDVEEAGARR